MKCAASTGCFAILSVFNLATNQANDTINTKLRNFINILLTPIQHCHIQIVKIHPSTLIHHFDQSRINNRNKIYRVTAECLNSIISSLWQDSGGIVVKTAEKLNWKLCISYFIEHIVVICIREMTEFALWFAYYDSFFLAQELKLNYEFYFHHVIQDSKWPVSVCPPLSEAYMYLEHFVDEEKNWIISKCKQEELEIVQTDINELMLFLKLEKSYALSFWQKDHRRIEASTVHFYTFLQMLIKALIPYQTMTIFQCRSANKLCVKLQQLQKLMNQILKCINPIAKVLSSPKFSDQSALIKNFFENWICFMKKLPNIKKSKLNHVHKLVKFVCLTNPIEICTVNKSLEYEQAIRKKSNTVGTNIQNNNAHTYPGIELFKSNVVNQSQEETGTENMKKQRKRKRSMSCASLVIKKIQEIILQKQEQIKLFKLPDFVLNYAIQEECRNKKLTISSLNSLSTKQKQKSASKFKTLTTNESYSYSRQHPHDSNYSSNKKQRQKSRSSYHKRSVVTSSGKEPHKNSSMSMIRRMSNQKRITKYYENEAERNEEITSVRSSKDSTIRRREPSVMTVNRREDGDKNETKAIFYIGTQTRFNLKQGSILRSKWEIVRMYLQQRIRIRKLKRILEMS